MQSKFLTDLNTPQKEAVLTIEGPVLILAGAGSGKTKCVTHRIAYLISEKGVPAENILAVTFTNKAAQEMRHRLEKMIGLSVYLPWLGTFHGVCVKILRNEYHILGREKVFTIYDSSDSKDLIKKILQDMSLDPKRYSPSAVLSLISGAKSELLSPKDYMVYANGPFAQVVSQIYTAYQRRLEEANGFDFDDIIMKTVELFRTEESVLKKYSKIFRYIHVDEYQDTNSAQYELIKLLATHRNICVVGDDFQAIYSWRGANYTNILNFEADYKNAKIIKLEQNYRSTKTILSAAQSVIERNRLRSQKNIWTANEDGVPITVYNASDGYDEVEFVISEIRALKQTGGNWNNYVVLYRTNAQSRLFEEVCMKQGIPYRLIGALRFWERKEVKDVISYCRFLFNPLDEISFYRIIKNPPRGIGDTTIAKINLQFLRKAMLDYSGAIEELAVTPRAKKSLNDFFAKFAKLRTFSMDSPAIIISSLIEDLGYKDFVKDGTEEGETRWQNVQEVLSVAASKESFAQFLEEAALASDIDNYDPTEPAITLMTIHNAKGLEFPVVFIAGLEEGLFPHSRSLIEPDQLEEERRLFYVGMTRAMRRLYLIFAQSRLFGGSFQGNLPSRFLQEIPSELKDEI